MTRKHEYVVARLVVRGKKFEILVKPQLAYRFREGDKIPIDEILVGDFVYKDVRKGLKASPEELRGIFGTDDIRKISEEIIRKGELQLTTEQRRELLEMKKKQIVNYIARSAVDPRTNTPIPPTRIEKAMEEARVSIDLYKSVEEQVPKIVKAISRILPIKIAKALLHVRIPAQYSSRVYSQLTRMGDVKKTTWLADGSLIAEIEIPAGMQAEAIDRLNQLTKGNVYVKVLQVK
ncbi:MAG: ribosome assembly factor SBDS [Thermoprotei archaeon]|nr:MAG: ribosome assembly factor SBDS [Thermoprotei archaeon]